MYQLPATLPYAVSIARLNWTSAAAFSSPSTPLAFLYPSERRHTEQQRIEDLTSNLKSKLVKAFGPQHVRDYLQRSGQAGHNDSTNKGASYGTGKGEMVIMRSEEGGSIACWNAMNQSIVNSL